MPAREPGGSRRAKSAALERIRPAGSFCFILPELSSTRTTSSADLPWALADQFIAGHKAQVNATSITVRNTRRDDTSTSFSERGASLEVLVPQTCGNDQPVFNFCLRRRLGI